MFSFCQGDITDPNYEDSFLELAERCGLGGTEAELSVVKERVAAVLEQ